MVHPSNQTECILYQLFVSTIKKTKSKDKNRGLIDDKLKTILRYANNLDNKSAVNKFSTLKFYEKLRNVLAHGDSLQREDLKEHRLYQKYYRDKENSLDFYVVYMDFFEQIGILIKELVE